MLVSNLPAFDLTDVDSFSKRRRRNIDQGEGLLLPSAPEGSRHLAATFSHKCDRFGALLLLWVATWYDLGDLAAVVFKGESHGTLKHLFLSASEFDITDCFLHSSAGGCNQEEENEAKKLRHL